MAKGTAYGSDGKTYTADLSICYSSTSPDPEVVLDPALPEGVTLARFVDEKGNNVDLPKKAGK